MVFAHLYICGNVGCKYYNMYSEIVVFTSITLVLPICRPIATRGRVVPFRDGRGARSTSVLTAAFNVRQHLRARTIFVKPPGVVGARDFVGHPLWPGYFCKPPAVVDFCGNMSANDFSRTTRCGRNIDEFLCSTHVCVIFAGHPL